MKKKILICIESVLYFRNFCQSGAFADLEARYDVRYAISSPEVRKHLEQAGVKNILSFEFSKERGMRWYHLTELIMVKLRHLCRTFQVKYDKQLRKRTRWLYTLLSLPLIYDLYWRWYVFRLGKNASFRKVVDDFAPDLVLFPTAMIDSLGMEILYTLKSHPVRTLMLINGWDNISSKGSIPHKPLYMGVWGPQSVRHATKIHGMPESHVFAVGAPHFKYYYHPEKFSGSEFKKMVGLPENKEILLFAGSARAFDETEALIQLERAIEDGTLPPSIHILYRPHPWRHPRTNEQSFYDFPFKHVTMDPQIADIYRATKSGSKIVNKPDAILPELEHYPAMYNAVTAVIHPCSTILVESAIMGKPSLAIAFGDGRHTFAPDTMIEYEHFADVFDIPGIVICRDRERFVADCAKLLEMGLSGKYAEGLKTRIRDIVSYDGRTYSLQLERLVTDTIFKENIGQVSTGTPALTRRALDSENPQP